MRRRIWRVCFSAVLGVVLLCRLAKPHARARQAGGAIPIDNDDLGGVVTGPKGPEAGVWVIAETTDLPTKFAKIVVTDDRGRYLLPDLPKASYNVWVRGYGLVDSPKIQTVPGKILNLTAVPAPNPRAAARVLPGRLLVLADESARQERVPRHRRHRATASRRTCRARRSGFASLKSGGCTACHQLGTKGTREIPKALGTFPSSVAAWDRRIQSGQAGGQMSARAQSRSAGGARWRCSPTGPTASPQAKCRRRRRVRGASSATSSSRSGTGPIRSPTCTTRCRPTDAIRRLNPNGPIYGSLELSSDYLPVLDPVTHTVEPDSAHRCAIRTRRRPVRRCRSRRRTGATK